MTQLARRTLVVAALLGMAGCASRRTASAPQNWSGRLSMQVRSDPPQAVSAAFELSGSPEQGQLQLNSPLGTSLVSAQWTPAEAVLRSGSDARLYRSMEDLLVQATGAAVPLAALFDWLSGVPTPVDGWLTDLSGLSQGRLQASRRQPGPAVELRIVLDR